MAMQGRHLNRKEVLAWNEPWTTRDRLRVTSALDAVPNGVYIVPPADGHIGVWINGRRALVICPGYMWWPGGRGTRDLPPDLFPDMHTDAHDRWHELSTFRLNTGGPTIPELRAEVCPRCFMELPLTGVCDNCG